MIRPSAYNGTEPYIFVSYSHKDTGRVLPIIQGLQERDFRIWYDEGLEVGSSWSAMIESHLYDCSYTICFVSRSFLNSENCKDEISYAKELKKGPLIVYLEELDLPRDFRFSYGRFHSLQYNDFSDLDSFLDKLCATSSLEECRDDYAPYLEDSFMERVSVTAAILEALQSSGDSAQNDRINTKQRYVSPSELFENAEEHMRRYEYGTALPLYIQAAEGGDARAQYKLYQNYNCGSCLVGKNESEAFKWLKMAAENGHVEAMYDLGFHYQYTRCREYGALDHAIEWYEKAARCGHPKAKKNLKECKSERFWNSIG